MRRRWYLPGQIRHVPPRTTAPPYCVDCVAPRSPKSARPDPCNSSLDLDPRQVHQGWTLSNPTPRLPNQGMTQRVVPPSHPTQGPPGLRGPRGRSNCPAAACGPSPPTSRQPRLARLEYDSSNSPAAIGDHGPAAAQIICSLRIRLSGHFTRPPSPSSARVFKLCLWALLRPAYIRGPYKEANNCT